MMEKMKNDIEVKNDNFNFMNTGKYNEGPIGCLDEAINLTESGKLKDKLANSFLKKGWIEIETRHYKKALKSFNKALLLFKATDNLKGFTAAKHGTGSVFYYARQYSRALEIFFSLRDKILQNRSRLPRARSKEQITLKDIALCYYKWENFKKAREYFNWSLKVTRGKIPPNKEIFLMYYIGQCWFHMGYNNKAEDAFFKALTVCDNNNLTYMISETLTSLGEIYRRNHNIMKAESFHVRALQYAKTTRNFHAHVMILINMGNLCYFNKDYKKATTYFTAALDETTQLIEKKETTRNIHQNLYLASYENQNYEKALKHLQKILILNNEMEEEARWIQNSLLDVDLKSETEDDFTLSRTDIKTPSGKTISALKDYDLTTEYNIEDMMATIYDSVANLLEVTNFGLYLCNSSKKTLESCFIQEGMGKKTERSEISEESSFASYCITQGKDIIIYDRESELGSYKNLIMDSIPENIQSLMYLPLEIGNTIIGAITLQHSEKNKYSVYDLNLVKTISAYISLTIENVRIKNEIRTLNSLIEEDTVFVDKKALSNIPNHDQLTGLPSEAIFYELLNQDIKKTKRNRVKIGLFYIIVDYDFEKRGSFLEEDIKTCDTEIGERFSRYLRAEDIIGKLDNSHYLLSVNDIHNPRDCRIVGEKLVKVLSEVIFTENQRIKPDVRVGITIFPDDGLTAQDIVSRAKKSASALDKPDALDFYEDINNKTSLD